MQVIDIRENQELVLEAQANDLEININNCKATISDVSNSLKRITLNGGELDYCLINKVNGSQTEFIVNSGVANIRIIDIDDTGRNNDFKISLEGNDAEVSFSVASICKHVNKSYKINSFNNVKGTKIKIDCFGISENDSELKYDVTSFIKKGAKNSVVNQNSKILLFDKESKGINNPILEIEENEVKANHGSSIGMIDEETLFYLTSRGIKEQDARNLVSLGKINYLIEEVKNENIKNDLLKEVLERE